MTFRIDSIALWDTMQGGWSLECGFKGFEGRGVYAVAEMTSRTPRLVITSTMDCSEHVTIEPTLPPLRGDRSDLEHWMARILHGLGWGPEVNHAYQVIER